MDQREDRVKTQREIITAEEALTSITADMFNLFVGIRQTAEVLEESVPKLRQIGIETAVDISAIAVQADKAEDLLSSTLRVIQEQKKAIADMEEQVIKLNEIIWELWAIRDTPAMVVEKLSNVATLVVNFDMYISSSGPFVGRVLRLAHPTTRDEALASLPPVLLSDWQQATARAVGLLPAVIIDLEGDNATADDPTR
jgi:hypothetical protein